MGLITSILVSAINLYMIIIFIYIIMSWIPQKEGIVADLYEALGQLCEPFLGIFRDLIPNVGMFDFSPIVAILVLQLIAYLIRVIL